MKGARFSTGMLYLSDDFQFIEDSKAKAIEETRYDLLQNPGVVRDSGTTPGHESEPLKVYVETDNPRAISVYGGIAYDKVDGRSRRIWVPDEPTNVPENYAEALSSSNVDMAEEYSAGNDFPGRPSRRFIKVFDPVLDTPGVYYVFIGYKSGEYYPRPLPTSEQVTYVRVYDSYEFRVLGPDPSASEVTALKSQGYLQLATLEWDGTAVTVSSDDRQFASALLYGDAELLAQHQRRFHIPSAIKRSDETYDYLKPVINNGPEYYVELQNVNFEENDGYVVNGQFLTTVRNTRVYFGSSDSSGLWFLYIDGDGYFSKTQDFVLADSQLPICAVQWTGSEITFPTDSTIYQPADYRIFGTVGTGEVSFFGAQSWGHLGGPYYTELVNAFKLLSQVPRLISSNPSTSSLRVSAFGNSVSITPLQGDDVVVFNGMVFSEVVNTEIAGLDAGTYYFYVSAPYASLTTPGNNLRYTLKVSYDTTYDPYATDRLYIAEVTVESSGGGYTASVVDLRPVGAILPTLFAKHLSTVGGIEQNVLPQPLICVSGTCTVTTQEATPTTRVYLTSDGTEDGVKLFWAPPLLQFYLEGGLPSYPNLRETPMTASLGHLTLPIVWTSTADNQGRLINVTAKVTFGAVSHYVDFWVHHIGLSTGGWEPSAETFTIRWVAVGVPNKISEAAVQPWSL